MWLFPKVKLRFNSVLLSLTMLPFPKFFIVDGEKKVVNVVFLFVLSWAQRTSYKL